LGCWMMHKFNAEHYPDPTAADALATVEREEKVKAWKPCVFICSPFAGDIEANTRRAIRYMRFAVASGTIPFAPHLLYPQVLEENDASQRELALFFGSVWLGKCDELWVFGNHISNGMAREIAKAKKRGIIIRHFNEACEEESA
jgi:hypothetical protein